MGSPRDEINTFLQKQLRRRGLDEVEAVEAARWLDAARLLLDSGSRPGKPLRHLLRSREIIGAEQRPPTDHGRWFVTRVEGSVTAEPEPLATTPEPPEPPPPSIAGMGAATAEDGISSQPASTLSRHELEQAGFVGWVTFGVLRETDLSAVPRDPGVYVVLRQAEGEPLFLETNPGGRFKGRDPTEPIDKLERKWNSGTALLYVGKAEDLRRRLRAYARFGAGEPTAHWGGRYLWQLVDARDFLVAWRSIGPGETAFGAEGALMRQFRLHRGGRLPFANIAGPRKG